APSESKTEPQPEVLAQPHTRLKGAYPSLLKGAKEPVDVKLGRVPSGSINVMLRGVFVDVIADARNLVFSPAGPALWYTSADGRLFDRNLQPVFHAWSIKNPLPVVRTLAISPNQRQLAV